MKTGKTFTSWETIKMHRIYQLLRCCSKLTSSPSYTVTVPLWRHPYSTMHLDFLPCHWSSILTTGACKKKSFMKHGFWKETEILMRNTPNPSWEVQYRKLFQHFWYNFLVTVIYILHLTAVRWTQFWPGKSSYKIIPQDKGLRLLWNLRSRNWP